MGILQERMRQLRKQNHLTQEQLAKKLREQYNLKTDRVMISKWETGFQTPGIYSISCMANIFGVSLDYLNGKDNSAQSSAVASLPSSPVEMEAYGLRSIGEQLEGLDFALYGETKDLTDEEKEKILEFIKFTKSQRK